MKKKGFTLVELIAAIAILSIIALIATPGILKNYNKSKIQAMTIQKSKLVEAGNILLDDYCKDSVNKEYKEKCKIYYQELDKDSASQLSEDKDYKYICVKDIKKLKYYTEELKYGGTPCQGVVVYELDKKTSLQTDSFSYVECSDVYPLEKTEKDIKMKQLFKNCFDDVDTDKEYEENKTYTVTIKFVENDPHGISIKNNKILQLKKEDYEKDVIFEIEATRYVKYGSTYEAVLNTGGKKVELVDSNPAVDEHGTKIFKITELPKENLTLSVVYTSVQHDIVTNYYRYYPTTSKEHNNEKMSSKTQTTVRGFNFETKEIDIPDTLEENINGTNEKFNLYAVYIDGEKQPTPINKNIDVADQDRKVDVIYQREEFNITYNNNGGTGCTTGRIKYNQPYGELCIPTRTGYTFKGWSLTLNGETLNEDENDLNDITIINDNYKDLTLYAKWEAHKFILVFHDNNALYGSVASKTCTYDEECKLPSNGYVKTCNDFTGWYLNSTSEGERFLENQDIKNYTSENKTINLYAGWLAKTHTLTFNANGGTVSQPNKTVTYMKTLGEFPTATRTGYELVGWYTSIAHADNTKEYKNYPWLFYADIYPDLYQAYQYDQEKLKNHYSEYGQREGRTKTEYSPSTLNITCANQAINAGWYPINYTITYNLNGGTNPSDAKTKYNVETENYTLPTPTRTGYEFEGWYSDSSLTTKVTSIVKGSTGNKILYSKWKAASSLPQFTYTGTYELVTDNDTIIASGSNNAVSIPSEYASYTGNWKIRFLTSGELKFTNLGTAASGIDVFLVGGGGAGGGGTSNDRGGGGGGGYTKTHKAISISQNEKYTIIVGAGGTRGSGNYVAGNRGGTSTAFGYSAAGGYGGTSSNAGAGGAGGSGGGGGGYNNSVYGAPHGGSDGSNGTSAADKGGTGQGTTTREFGESSGKLYAGGGAGGTSRKPGNGGAGGGGAGEVSGTPNTGGGGGGAGANRKRSADAVAGNGGGSRGTHLHDGNGGDGR